jgi:hypothetical protein
MFNRSIKNMNSLKHKTQTSCSSPVHSHDNSPLNTREDCHHVSRRASYARSMQHVGRDLPAIQRFFSKVIHNPIIEITSNIIGSTVARPNAIISGSLFSFSTVLILYFLARHNGFSLSGFEAIGAFTIGWAIGICFDIIHALIRHK